MDNFIGSQIQEMPISQKILRNTLYNIAATIGFISVSLLLTPYILNYIGIERFGIWAIINVLITYFGFFDFSLGTPIIKYVSEFYAVKDFSKFNKLFNTAFIFYLILAAAVGIVCFAISGLILNFFTIPVEFYQESLFAFRVAVVTFVCLNLSIIFTHLLVGLQLIDITSKISIISSIINVIGTVFVLKSGFGLRGLIVNYLIVILIRGIFSLFIVVRKLPSLRFSIFYFEKTIFKTLFNFGIKLHLAKFAFLINFQIDKLLLARFLNMGSVAFYELGSKITYTVRRLSISLISAILPAASEIDATRDHAVLHNLYLRASKYLALGSIPVFIFVIFNASLILKAWLGEAYFSAISSVLVIQILGVGYLANVITGVATETAFGIGKPEFELRRSLLVAPLNLALSIALILKFGLMGACMGTTISLIVGSIFLFKQFHGYINKPLKYILFYLWKPIVASILVNILIMPFYYSELQLSSSLRINCIATLLIKWTIFSLFYLIIIVAFRAFDKQDLELARQRLPLIGRIIR